MWWASAAGFASAFGLTILSILVLTRFAAGWGLVDHPGGRKHHDAPTPVIGGLAMVAGAGVAISAPVAVLGPQVEFIGLGGAVVILLVVGVLDDRHGLPWQARIVAQMVAALSFSAIGGVQIEQVGPIFGFAPIELGAMSLPLTVFATVGLINAMNMVDGVDGLAGSSAFVALSMVAAAGLYAGNLQLAGGLFTFLGAIAAFLVFNARFPWQPRARVFMGNAGSTVLGLIIAWSSFRLTQNPFHPITPLLAPFLVAPALIDCLVLIARRVANKRSPFSADRDHLHHILLNAGFAPSQVVAILTLATLVLGGGAALACRAHVPKPVFALAFLIVFGVQLTLTMRPRQAAQGFARFRERLGARRGNPSSGLDQAGEILAEHRREAR
jgi:UDP-GlcNAc:undecaprenyl-phosphate GlcNAc-1-phosphate transferase